LLKIGITGFYGLGRSSFLSAFFKGSYDFNKSIVFSYSLIPYYYNQFNISGSFDFSFVLNDSSSLDFRIGKNFSEFQDNIYKNPFYSYSNAGFDEFYIAQLIYSNKGDSNSFIIALDYKYYSLYYSYDFNQGTGFLEPISERDISQIGISGNIKYFINSGEKISLFLYSDFQIRIMNSDFFYFPLKSGAGIGCAFADFIIDKISAGFNWDIYSYNFFVKPSMLLNLAINKKTDSFNFYLTAGFPLNEFYITPFYYYSGLFFQFGIEIFF